jgi:hemoglobin/transferrin/lactoferrin receptor protein
MKLPLRFLCVLSVLCGELLLPRVALSQDTTQLDEVIFSANKFTEKKKNIAQRIDVINNATIQQLNAQNTGDLLSQTGRLFVQKSQQGGSSPVIRGFEASRVLLLVDGIRMNNLIYRAGHLQNVITIDQNMLERVEVLYGPSSTIFGSDALGGAVNLITKQPRISRSRVTEISGSGFLRFSSANNERTGNVVVNLAKGRWAWLQAVTVSNFDDMKMGSNHPDEYPSFGRRSSYVSTFNGRDTVVGNPDDRVQRHSGYSQWDLLQKLLFKQSDKISHLLNVQLSNSSNIPRYDRLQDIRNGSLRFAEWYYGPQQRSLLSYQLNVSQAGFVNELRFNVNHQIIEESRQTRDFGRYDRFDSRIEKVNVTGFVADARKMWGNHELSSGIDVQLNNLRSTATRTDLNTGAIAALDTRYPDGINRMNSAAIYAQHLLKIIPEKLILNDGIRVQSIWLKSTIENNSFFKLPYNVIEQTNTALTGNIGLVYLPRRGTRISAVLSSGFRAPNVDDNSKIFESSTSARQLVIPNGDLRPEYTYNADLSIGHSTGIFNFEVTGFYTWFRNAIVKAPFTLNGADSVEYDGVLSQVLANQNANRAYITGITAASTGKFSEHWSGSAQVTFTKGRYHTNEQAKSLVFTQRSDGSYIDSLMNVSQKPLDHIPPVYGRVNVNYRSKILNAELYMLFNGWKRITNMNAEGEDNAQYAAPSGYIPGSVIPDGYPSWFTVNLKASYHVSNSLQLQAGVENIFDRNYRPFASGFSAAGRNFIVALRAAFDSKKND